MVVGVSTIVAAIVADGTSSTVSASSVVNNVFVGGCSCQCLLACCFVLFLGLSCFSGFRFRFSACCFAGRSSSGRFSCVSSSFVGWVLDLNYKNLTTLGL